MDSNDAAAARSVPEGLYHRLHVTWRPTGEAARPFSARVLGRDWSLRDNRPHERPRYTLLIDGNEVAEVEHWPASWRHHDRS